ncbi:NADPH:quinone reductase-like protein [Planoprotostelium fungivorum]|uniref:NADPH:quinone reductase-like protein n=1 Tax=Planoprotostelium fungivorum TaxID=1890364 RepID=A0A2P6NT33_9EUKA|nr:NADPH:quinone reductase-like protein [Planoprotostelium fungivorum]
MEAVLVTAPGGADKLIIGQVPKPTLDFDGGDQWLIVKVSTAGINRADIQQREGKYPPPKGASEILGLEICGTVEELGKSVTKWKKGDRIVSLISGGGYAQYCLVHQDLAFRVPEHFDDVQAAAVPEAYLTAYQALVWCAGLKDGYNVLIHAGASGVGLAATQVVKAFKDTKVVITAGTDDKIEFCKKIGADLGLNYKKDDKFSKAILDFTQGRGVDIIIDFVGANYWKENLASLAEDGTMVHLALLSGTKAPEFDMSAFMRKRITVKGSTLRARPLEYRIKLTHELEGFIRQHLEDKKIVPTIHKVFDFKKVVEAHKMIEANENTGKVILNNFHSRPSVVSTLSLSSQSQIVMEDSELTLSIPLSSLMEEFVCPICFNVITNCVTTPCGHNFCDHCIRECLNRKHACPCCNASVKAPDLLKNHHHDRIVTIIQREKEIASKKYFERVIKGTKDDDKEDENKNDPASPKKTIEPNGTPIEVLFQKHLQKSLMSYDAYYKELEEKRDQIRSKQTDFYAGQVLTLQNEAEAETRKGNVEAGSNALSKSNQLKEEWHKKNTKLDDSFTESIRLLQESYEGYLSSVAPAPNFLPIAISVSVAGRDIAIKKLIVKPTENSRDVYNKLEMKIAELGNPLTKPLDAKKNFFLLRRGLAVEGSEEAAGIQMKDEFLPLVQYNLRQGDHIELQGQIFLKNDAPEKCFSQTFKKDEGMRCDYFTCKDCKLNWICRRCSESCHSGHKVVDYIMNHPATNPFSSVTIYPRKRDKGTNTIMPTCPVKRTKSQERSDLHMFNEWFHEVYSNAHGSICRNLPEEHPIIMVLGTDMKLILGTHSERVRFSPEVFDHLKMVAHVPLTFTLILQPFLFQHKQGKLDDTAMKQLAKLIHIIDILYPQLSEYFPESEKNILQLTQHFARIIQRDGLSPSIVETFVGQVRPFIDRNVREATEIHLKAMHRQVTLWRSMMTDEQWSHLRVSVTTSPVPRHREMHTQYFSELLGVKPGVSARLVHAEDLTEEGGADILDLLASHTTDEEIGMTFWGSKKKMHDDVMAQDCDALLSEMFPRKKWQDAYKENKPMIFFTVGVLSTIFVCAIADRWKIVIDARGLEEKRRTKGLTQMNVCYNEQNSQKPNFSWDMSAPVEYRYSEEKGRHFVAARNIKSGEEVLRVAPSAAALRIEYLHEYCSGCFRPLPLIPSIPKNKGSKHVNCRNCKRITFCRECAKKELVIHEESGECQLLKMDFQDDPLIHMFSRILLRLLHLSRTGSNEVKNLVKETTGPAKTPLNHAICDTWGDVLSLQPGIDTEARKQSSSLTVPVMALIGNAGDLKFELPAEEIMENIVSILLTNGHEISYPRPLGVGLYPTAAVFNHSCLPNVAFSHDNQGAISFRALSDVEKGTELCSSYIDIILPTAERQITLRSRYGFDCHCSRCTNSPDDHLLRGYRCPNAKEQQECAIEPLEATETEDVYRCRSCKGEYPQSTFLDAESNVEAHEKRALNLSAQENFTAAFGELIKGFALGSEKLHPCHHLNWNTYQCMAVTCSEMGRHEQSAKFMRRQLDVLDRLTQVFLKEKMKEKANKSLVGGPCTAVWAVRYRQLSFCLQDIAQDIVAKNKDAGKVIQESRQNFESTKKWYAALLGGSHWYSILLERVVRSFDDADEDAQRIWEFL